ncbi:hypothetical protein CONPUDRAFT_158548 [Coniophora puteana RWD-64-598 SS2]|uniref:Uncharacterized protein n=1 Tax=Coniophora puteana (strain RWD-64-598) TaxID=741705 RepID=A0A5M3MD15_CONPW|nr:uncharacterized protein CONPUDRAFT_158548 [Coniophora puteana RWD-64-598 SS2]EIW76531.1 hypothetical protein CONPUDRAFT_158548 [Coniophora puteana RWD-64-598 SS2]
MGICWVTTGERHAIRAVIDDEPFDAVGWDVDVVGEDDEDWTWDNGKGESASA